MADYLDDGSVNIAERPAVPSENAIVVEEPKKELEVSASEEKPVKDLEETVSNERSEKGLEGSTSEEKPVKVTEEPSLEKPGTEQTVEGEPGTVVIQEQNVTKEVRSEPSQSVEAEDISVN